MSSSFWRRWLSMVGGICCLQCGVLVPDNAVGGLWRRNGDLRRLARDPAAFTSVVGICSGSPEHASWGGAGRHARRRPRRPRPRSTGPRVFRTSTEKITVMFCGLICVCTQRCDHGGRARSHDARVAVRHRRGDRLSTALQAGVRARNRRRHFTNSQRGGCYWRVSLLLRRA